MSKLQSLRLAQFWHLRLQPILGLFTQHQAISAGELFEATGWLIEGVFCGFFNAHEADVVFIRLAPLFEACGSPASPIIGESLAAQITRLQESDEPFRESIQMTDGPQKKFELPLFQHVLLLANRLAGDPLADLCGTVIRNGDLWDELKPNWHLVDASNVAEALANVNKSQINVASLAAGYIRMLEHMEASRSFFRYAEFHSPRGSDFDSYCQRIGALNGWRVPLSNSEVNSRFTALPDLLEFAVRPILEEASIEWSDFQRSFSKFLSSLVQAWEAHHLSNALEVA